MTRVLFETLWHDFSDGWSIASRAYARALKISGLDVQLRSWMGLLEEPAAEVMAEVGDLLAPLPERHDLYLFSCTLSGPERAAYSLDPLRRVHRPRAFYTMFERCRIERAIAESLNDVDGVMVPCSANLEALQEAGCTTATYVPYPYFPDDPHLTLPAPTGEPRVFYWIGRWEPRKAPHNLVRAFLRAFRPGEAELHLKVGPVPWPGYPAPEEAIVEALSEPSIARRWTTVRQVQEGVKVLRGRWPAAEVVALHAQGHVYASASRGEGLCAVKGTLVDTETGPVPIEKIRAGEWVFTHKGRLRRVIHKTTRWYHSRSSRSCDRRDSRIVCIRPRGISDTLSFTPNHPHYIVRRHAAKTLRDVVLKPEFVEARLIEPGDLWVVPKRQPAKSVTSLKVSDFVDVAVQNGRIFCKHSFPKHPQASIMKIARDVGCSFQFVSKILRGQQRGLREKGKRVLAYAKQNDITVRQPVEFPNEIELTPEFMFFLGHYIAEGCSTVSTVVLSTHRDETWGRDLSKRAILQTFGLIATEHHHATTKGTQLRFGNLTVARFLKKLCGDGAKNKRIDPLLRDSPHIAHLLRGLFYGDGHQDRKQKRFGFHTSSSRLASDIVGVLNSLSIFASKERANRRGSEEFSVRVAAQHSTRFVETICPIKYSKTLSAPSAVKQIRLLEDSNNFYLPIREVRRVFYKGMVHNFAVEDDESYTVGGGFATHNCLPS